MTLPANAPVSPPRLKKPWNDDIVGLPRAASTSAACVFIATLPAPPIRPSASVAPNRHRHVRRHDRKHRRSDGQRQEDLRRRTRTDPRYQPADQRLADDATKPDVQESKAEYGRIELQPMRDDRDMYRPDRPGEAEDEELRRDWPIGPVAPDTRRRSTVPQQPPRLRAHYAHAEVTAGNHCESSTRSWCAASCRRGRNSRRCR